MNFKFPHGMIMLGVLSVISCTQSAFGMLPSQLGRLASLTRRIGLRPLTVKNPVNTALVRNIMTSQKPQLQCDRFGKQSQVSRSERWSRNALSPLAMLKAYKLQQAMRLPHLSSPVMKADFGAYLIAAAGAALIMGLSKAFSAYYGSHTNDNDWDDDEEVVGDYVVEGRDCTSPI